jgi:tRNA A37 methylthiotransferase MiaB
LRVTDASIRYAVDPMSTGPSVYLETFGCQMNELDSELVRGHLRSLGYRFTEDFTTADVVLYNTCSVREQAENKAYSRLGLVGLRKKAGEQVILGVLGLWLTLAGPFLTATFIETMLQVIEKMNVQLPADQKAQMEAAKAEPAPKVYERCNKPAPAAQLLHVLPESMLFSEVERRGFEVLLK